MTSVELQSKEHRDLLDIVDKLRSQGLGRYVDLPEIIVCGDQSAGKSSVLEAISGMSFPTKDNFCTRFPTELILRHSTTSGIKITITPGLDRPAEEREKLLAFKPTVSCDVNGQMDSDELSNVIESAKEAMGLSDAKVFSTDALRVDLSGPDQPHLTMVDLPGLFRAGNKDQSVTDATTVRNMVRSYMMRPRSIILAVVSAKSDSALQDVTEFARELDPQGVRTLGLITKPDTLDAGSDSEHAYLKLAENKDVAFQLGWHVLKNRDFKMRNATTAERDAAEDGFFCKGVWATIDPSLLGVRYLKPRLSKVLKDQILRQLPSLIQDVESGLADCDRRLQLLGTPRPTITEQRRYLLQVSQQFSELMKLAVDGAYSSFASDKFFGSAKTTAGYQKRLRAVVQNTLTDWQEDMALRGHERQIDDKLRPTDSLTLPKQITRTDFLDEVKSLMRRSRGRELPGTFNPLFVGELFAEQCQPWQRMTQELGDNILAAVHETAHAIISYVAVDETVDNLLEVLRRGIAELKTDLDRKLIELLDPHYNGHPITYNHYLTETVNKIQASRKRAAIEAALKDVFRLKEIPPGGVDMGRAVVDLSKLVGTLMGDTEADMERQASSMAVDYMQAYYKVALKNYCQDVDTLAIEACLIKRLPSLFNPERVFDMADSEVSRLGGENETTASERSRCAEKRDVLLKGLHELRRLDAHRPAPGTEKTSTGANTPKEGSTEAPNTAGIDASLSMTHSNGTPTSGSPSGVSDFSSPVIPSTEGITLNLDATPPSTHLVEAASKKKARRKI